MRSNKLVKRIIIIVVVLAVVAGAGFGGYTLLKNRGGEAVNVYAVSDFSTDYSWGETNESYGMVTTDKIQSVYISSTQKVTEVYVTEGQNLLVGDPILAYDTTLSDIELQRASIQLQKLQLQLDTAKKELATINTYKPYYPVTPTATPVTTPDVGETVTPPYLAGGSGTMEDPLVYIWNNDDEYTSAFMARMLEDKAEAATRPSPTPSPSPSAPVESEPVVTDTPPSPEAGLGEAGRGGDDDLPSTDVPTPGESDTPAEPTTPENVVYATFVVRQGNAIKGQILDYWGIKFTRQTAGFSFRLVEAVLPAEPSDDDGDTGDTGGGGYSGPTYTAAEIAQMKADKTAQIRDLDLSIRQAQVEYDRMEKEVNDGVVRSEFDGTVKSIIEAEEAKASGQPMIQVSGGGGYYVEGAVGELMLDTIVPGQTVTVMSWESGMSFDGQVVSVSDYPTTNANSYGEGNNNVSYYPFKVFIDESASLREGEYVSMTYTAAQGTELEGVSKLYLQNMFVLKDGGKSYVYLRNADGLLEKREVVTGKSLWGSYYEIKSGLTREDWVAFPYGKEVKDGAETVEATAQDLYGGTYY